MKRRKSLLGLAISVVTLLCAFLSGCATHDTFQGQISANSYNSKERAAEAFIERELNGESTNVEYMGYQTTTALSKAEITELPIGANANIQSGEKGIVSFQEKNGALASFGGGFNLGVETQEIYILTDVEGEFYYFVPAAQKGDRLTKSYWDSVFNVNNYRNVTMEYVLEYTYDVDMSGMGYSYYIEMDMTMEMEVRIAEPHACATISCRVDIDTNELTSDLQEYLQYLNFDMSIYFLKTTNGYKMYEKNILTNEGWGSSSLGNSVTDIVEYIMDEEDYIVSVDYSYFKKTGSGFEIDSKKMQEYFDEAFNDELLDGALDEFEDMGFTFNTMDVEYEVIDGRLDEASVEVGFDIDVSSQGARVQADLDLEMAQEFSKFGKTKIDIPSDLYAFMAQKNDTLA